MTLGLINANPVVHAKKERVARTEDPHGDDAVDPLEIYDILSFISFFSSQNQFVSSSTTAFSSSNLDGAFFFFSLVVCLDSNYSKLGLKLLIRFA